MRGQTQHCTVCHKSFGATATGDAHRIGAFPDKRHCLTDSELLTRGWTYDATREIWRTPSGDRVPWRYSAPI